jgi:hypothetical protein
VDFADFLLVAANFGKNPTGWSQGNFDIDQQVAFADFLVIASNFGFVSPAIPIPLAVPIPLTLNAPAADLAIASLTESDDAAASLNESLNLEALNAWKP